MKILFRKNIEYLLVFSLLINFVLLATTTLVAGDNSVAENIVSMRSGEEKQLFNECANSYQNREYDNAIDYCSRLLDIRQSDYEAYFLLGMSYAEKGNFKKAVEYYQKSTNINPNQMILISMSGIFTDEQNYRNNINKTVECYKNEITKNPSNYQAYNDLGYLLFLLKGDRKFEEYYKKSIEINPDYAQAHYNLALYYLYSDKNLALEECEILERLNKDLAKAIREIIESSEKEKKKL